MPIECRLCEKTKELKRSHVIPDAIFRRLFRENQGRAITFNDDKSSWIEYSSDSWWEYLLCDACEKHLNEEYEQYSISALRNSLKTLKISIHKGGITFNPVDTTKFQLFLVSLLWRAAISSLPAYSKVYLPQPWENEIRNCLLDHKKVRSSLVGIRISRLSDKTPNGFSLGTLKSLVISPLFRAHKGNFSFCFLIEGFFIEIFVPGLKLSERNTIGVINPTRRIIVAQYLDVFDVPELVALMASGYGKYVDGKSKVQS